MIAGECPSVPVSAGQCQSVRAGTAMTGVCVHNSCRCLSGVRPIRALASGLQRHSDRASDVSDVSGLWRTCAVEGLSSWAGTSTGLSTGLCTGMARVMAQVWHQHWHQHWHQQCLSRALITSEDHH